MIRSQMASAEVGRTGSRADRWCCAASRWWQKTLLTPAHHVPLSRFLEMLYFRNLNSRGALYKLLLSRVFNTARAVWKNISLKRSYPTSLSSRWRDLQNCCRIWAKSGTSIEPALHRWKWYSDSVTLLFRKPIWKTSWRTRRLRQKSRGRRRTNTRSR